MINSIYLRKDVQSQMQQSFEQQKVLVLNDFLDMDGLNEIKPLWNVKGKPECRADLYSYEKLPNSKTFLKPEFLSFLANIVGRQPKKISLETRKFGHRDFTLIHDEVKQQKRFVILYRNVQEWENAWGGQAVFTKNNATPLIFPLTNNQLVILACDKDTFEFVKYVNNLAGEKRFLEVKIII
jgi:hypothetical protein